MSVYNYFITVRDGKVNRLIHFSVRAEHITIANLAISTVIVNSNERTKDDNYTLYKPRLASIREERRVNSNEQQ